MDSFTLTKKLTETEHVNVFICDPSENDGSGWSYTGNSDGEYLNIEWAGKVRLSQLSVLATLFSYVIDNDVDRNTVNEEAHFTGTVFFDSKVELYEAMKTYEQPIHGAPAHAFFVASTVHADVPSKRLMSIAVNRINDNYYVMIGGVTALTFHTWEIEGMMALIKVFIR
jgi:hypothetical protein